MNSTVPPLDVHFQCPSSDSEDGRSETVDKFCDQNNEDDVEFMVKNDYQPIARPSPKLEIVDRSNDGVKNKFSIWSEILMEEQLTDTVNQSLKIKDLKAAKKRLKKKNYVDKDSENYFQWSQKDFDEKFAAKSKKKTNKNKNKPTNEVIEICRKLKESRTDLIKKVIEVLGEPKTRQLVAEVLDIEDAGGIMTADNVRRRSPGGVFFFLIKKDSTITMDQKKLIFAKEPNEKSRKIKAKKSIKKGQNNKDNKSNNQQKKKKKKKKKKKSNPTKSKH